MKKANNEITRISHQCTRILLTSIPMMQTMYFKVEFCSSILTDLHITKITYTSFITTIWLCSQLDWQELFITGQAKLDPEHY